MTPLSLDAIPIAAGASSMAYAIDLLKVLACAGLVAAAVGRLRIAVIPGFLIAGAIIGPGALGLIDDARSIGEITSVATMLLMFGIGLHLDTSVLRKDALSILTAGLLTTLGTILIASPIAMAFGLEPPAAVAVAMVLSMSSTAVVMRLLQQKRELYSAHGRLSFGVLLVQDLLVVVMLTMLPILATMGTGTDPVPSLQSAVDTVAQAKPIAESVAPEPPIWVALLAVTLMLVLGKITLPRFMTMIAKGRSDEILLVIAAAVALGAAVLTGFVGLSPELGAFLAGFLLSSTPFRYQLSGQISPIRDLFMAVFFTAIGLKLDLSTIVPDLPVVLACTALVVLVKASVISSVAWAVGASVPIAVRAGLTLAQAGEFSLMLAASAAALGLFDEHTGSILIATIVLTLILAPSLDTLGAVISRRIVHLPPAPWFKRAAIGDSLTRTDEPSETGAACDDSLPGGGSAKDPCRVIIAGFGPVGRACAERFDREGVQATIVELNPKTVRTQAALGRSIIYGDITNPDVLENAGIDEARAVLITMPDHEAMLRAVSVIRRLRPDIYIAVRANLLSWANRARELGANDVAVEEIAVADELARHAINVAQGVRSAPQPPQVDP